MIRLITYKKFASFSNLSYLKEYTKDNKLPHFVLNSNQFEIINDPMDFYAYLNQSIKSSVHRIGISSLYLGTGGLERYILHNLKQNYKRNQNVKMRLLFDYYRSNRYEKGESGQQLIKNMFLECNNQNSELRFGFFIPNETRLSRLLENFGKFNQVRGVHHIKLYVFDNNVIISGANLSHSYFTHRQDRYLVIKNCEEFSNYIFDFIDVMIDGSHRLQKSGNLETQNNKGLKNYIKLWKFSNKQTKLYEQIQKNPKEKQDIKTQKKQSETKDIQLKKAFFKEKIRQQLNKTFDQYKVQSLLMKIQQKNNNKKILPVGQKVYIFPAVQLNLFGDDHDKKLLIELLKKNVKAQSSIRIASGYMNFPYYLIQILLQSKQKLKILTASPQANSFYEGGRIKKYIPHFYRIYEYWLLKYFRKRQKTQYLQLYQYRKWGWTFHTKGMWIQQKTNNDLLTIIGSSNYNRRSYQRDTQFQFYIYSSCELLNDRLNKEWYNLQKQCIKITQQQIIKDKEIKIHWFKQIWAKLLNRFM